MEQLHPGDIGPMNASVTANRWQGVIFVARLVDVSGDWRNLDKHEDGTSSLSSLRVVSTRYLSTCNKDPFGKQNVLTRVWTSETDAEAKEGPISRRRQRDKDDVHGEVEAGTPSQPDNAASRMEGHTCSIRASCVHNTFIWPCLKRRLLASPQSNKV